VSPLARALAAVAIAMGVAAAATAIALSLNGCGAAANLPTLVDVESYSAALDECVQAADARPQADACRAQKRAQLCQSFPAVAGCDGGVE
jgi:hypothetical protein